MSGVSVSGATSTSSSNGSLGTGIDVASTVASLMQVQQLPLTQMQNEQTQFNSQASAVQSINTDLSSLQTAVQALSDFNGALSAQTTSSSNSNLLTASSDGTAQIAKHQIVINNLAETASEYTNVPASSTLTAGSGFKIQVGNGTAVQVTVPSGSNTLAGLARAINNTAGIGVTASVITDATGSRLALVSNTSGAAGNIAISSNTTGLTFNSTLTDSIGNARAPKDASFTVDGIAIDSASNTVTGVIPGLTLNLNGADPNSSVTLGVSPDATQATTAVQNFVSAYNKVIQDINAQESVSAGQTAPPLVGDSTLSLIQTQLYSNITYSMTNADGSVNQNNGINSLADLGITMNNDGTLSLNSTQLNAALTSNNAAVLNFFQTPTTGFAQQFNTMMEKLTSPISGPLTVELNGINASISSLQSQISDFQARMNTIQQQLTTEYTSVNTTLQQLPILLEQMNSQLGSLG